MISVPIDRIVPLTDARDNFSRLIHDIETLSDGLYVLTKGGKPAIALINIKYLEEIMTSGPAANHQARITSHEPDHKPEVSRKVHEPIHRPAPVKLPEPPNPPSALSGGGGANLPKPNFEVPRITTAPISPSTGLPSTPSTPLGVNGENTPKVAPPFSNYDVKPTVNPTWTGEEATAKPLAPSPSTVLGVNQSPVPSLQAPNPPIPTKPPVNPWPIIPPRKAEISSNLDSPIIPPRQSPAAEPLAPSGLAPSQNSVPAPAPKPDASSPSTGLGVNPLPESSFPKMVAPPPPPPPSSLPRIPSSFQTVPVPINGNKEQLAPSSLAPSSLQPDASPPAGGQMPGASLPPPPITTAPAPFTGVSTPTAPASAPKPADSIAFDQPPKTIPEPGEELPMPSAVSPSTELPSTQLGVNDVADARSSSETRSQPAANPLATPPPSVKDLEI